MNNSNVADTTQCFFNFIDQIGVIPRQHRVQAFFESDFRLAEPLTYFNEISVSRNANRTFQQVGSFTNGAAVGGLIAVPASHPFNFFKADPADPRKIIAVDPAQWNPAVDQAVPVVASIRPQGQYLEDDKRQTNTYIRAVNGLDLSLGHDWRGTLAHEYAHAQFEENNPLIVNATAFNSLLASGRYNPFGTSVVNPTLVSPKDGTSVAANSEEILDQVFYTSNGTAAHRAAGRGSLRVGRGSRAADGHHLHCRWRAVPHALAHQHARFRYPRRALATPRFANRRSRAPRMYGRRMQKLSFRSMSAHACSSPFGTRTTVRASAQRPIRRSAVA